MDFLVWQGYPPAWVMTLTLRQFLAHLDAAARRLNLQAKAGGMTLSPSARSTAR